MTSSTLTRRTAFAGTALAGTALAGAAVLAFVPVAALATTKQTAIGSLWADAEAINVKLNSYRAQIAASAETGGISGWMRLGGEANTLGGQRYAKLMGILHAAPESQSDLAILARVVLDEEIQNGAKGYAADRFATATIEMLSVVA